MLRSSLAAFSLFLVACLPAYDNHSINALDTVDMADPNPCTMPSGKRLSATPYLILADVIQNTDAVTLRIDGCTGPLPSVGHAATVSSRIDLALPRVFDGQPRYLIAERDETKVTSDPPLTNWIAPPVILDGKAWEANMQLHLVASMGSVRAAIASELASGGLIPASDGDEVVFAADYSFAFGRLVTYNGDTFGDVKGTTFAIGGDTTRDRICTSGQTTSCCDRATSCCVYYANDIGEYFNTPRSKMSLLDVAAKSSPSGFFAVVCPKATTDPEELQVSVTGAPAAFGPFAVPRRLGDAVTIEYIR